MASDRLFFPASAVESWLADGALALDGDELVVTGEGRVLGWVDAVRILDETSGSGDPYALAGRVKTNAWLASKGAEVGSSHVRVGASVYGAIRGLLGTPIGVRAPKPRGSTPPPPPIATSSGTVVLDDPKLFSAAARKEPPR